MSEEFDGVPLVAEPTERELNDRQLLDYREHKRDLLEWLLYFGKEPAKAEGYATVTVRQVSYKTDQFYRWLWVEQDGYTTEFDTEDLDDYLRSLIYSDEDYSSGFLSNVQKCLNRLSKWRATELGRGEYWEPENTFSHSKSQSGVGREPEGSAPRNALTAALRSRPLGINEFSELARREAPE